jgi:hypothetical protein
MPLSIAVGTMLGVAGYWIVAGWWLLLGGTPAVQVQVAWMSLIGGFIGCIALVAYPHILRRIAPEQLHTGHPNGWSMSRD